MALSLLAMPNRFIFCSLLIPSHWGLATWPRGADMTGGCLSMGGWGAPCGPPGCTPLFFFFFIF